MKVRFFPKFERWLSSLALEDTDVFSEVMALINALEHYGKDLENTDESHPVRSSKLNLHALRRTPATLSTPYATGNPILRLVYGYSQDAQGQTEIVMLIGGDKSNLGNLWYPPHIAEAEQRLRSYNAQRSQLNSQEPTQAKRPEDQNDPSTNPD
jgi:hypothetical protein